MRKKMREFEKERENVNVLDKLKNEEKNKKRRI